MTPAGPRSPTATTNAADAGDPAVRAVRWRRLVLVGLLLPLLSTAVLLWSTTGRADELDRVPVAVVNNDKIITSPQPMAAGREIAAQLTQPSSDDTADLDWTLADSQDATAGLRDGDYYAVLTIPPDFSQAILSTGTDKPARGKLTLTSNAAASNTVPYISQEVADAAAATLAGQATRGYLGNVYQGFNQLAQANQQAADSAAQVAQGTDQVASGASSLDQGAGELADGLDTLSTGADELSDGTDALSGGADDLASGASGLAAGARQVEGGADRLSSSASTLAHKSGELAGASRRAASGAARAAKATRVLTRFSQFVARDLARLEEQCGAEGATEVFCRELRRATRRATLLSLGTGRVNDGVADLASVDRRLAGASGELATANRKLAQGADTLRRGSRSEAQASGRLDAASEALADAARQVAAVAVQVADGTTTSAGAGDQLASGSSSLSAGATSADSGAHQLQQGLQKGADESPTYTKDQKTALEKVVSEPVVVTDQVQHTAHGNGWLVALVLGVVLWLAALLSMLLRGVGEVLAHGGSPVSSRRLVAVQLRPTTTLALLQAAAVLAALPLLQLHPASPVQLVLLTVLAAAAFSLVGVALRWAFRGVGVVVFVLLLALQAAALGNVLPIETAPGVVQTLNTFLPLTAYVNGASQAASGGEVWSVVATVTILLAWSLVAGLVSLMVVRRRRMLPASRVSGRPQLVGAGS